MPMQLQESSTYWSSSHGVFSCLRSASLFLLHWSPIFSLISSFFTSSLAPSPSISPPGNPKEIFNCSEMSTVSWAEWLSSHVGWHESLIHFSFHLFAVIQGFLSLRGSLAHLQALCYFSQSLIAGGCTWLILIRFLIKSNRCYCVLSYTLLNICVFLSVYGISCICGV